MTDSFSDIRSNMQGYGVITEHWERLYSEASNPLPWEVNYIPQEILIWPQYISSADARILDIGCGRGIHTLTLAKSGFSVTGIDISKAAINTAKRIAKESGLGNAVFKVANIISYRPRRLFDFCFDYSVFHHIPEEVRNNYLISVYHALKAEALYGLVCYAENDEEALGQRVRIGKFGNIIYHPTRDEIITLFSKWFELVSYNETTLGRNKHHPAHHFVFRKVSLTR